MIEKGYKIIIDNTNHRIIGMNLHKEQSLTYELKLLSLSLHHVNRSLFFQKRKSYNLLIDKKSKLHLSESYKIHPCKIPIIHQNTKY